MAPREESGHGSAVEKAVVDFRTEPARYRHWRLEVAGRVATLWLDVREDEGIKPGYKLKLNSYDLGVDIELYDAVQRLRFEHPEVAAVIVTSAKDRVFSAGANIAMLGQSTHCDKVNFCKFTNETRLSIEDASRHSGQRWIAAINGTAAGGGYELALATDHILLADDGSTAVSLPEVPLLAVLPATGGLTRLTDKRMVRRDRADFFCTTSEGIRGTRAREWRLVDELAPRSRLLTVAAERAAEATAASDRPAGSPGIALTPLVREGDQDHLRYPWLNVEIDRAAGTATLTAIVSDEEMPTSIAAIQSQGAAFWPLALARALDDAILHLRHNEPEIGTWVLRTEGQPTDALAADAALLVHSGHWLVREILLYWKRVLKRLDVSSHSLIALIEPGSCFVGTLLELALAADRSYMLDGAFDGGNLPPPSIMLTGTNFGPMPMGNGLTRLETRFLAEPGRVDALALRQGESLGAAEAEALGLVTFCPDDIDWEDEVRLAIEERASFSPDALTAMEASLRFAGPETMETKIFGRLSAWQNWIFQRPNAVGPEGALKLYGTGRKSQFDRTRV
jgi:benzoyl-CoA-dihydrodiol lyase